VSDDGASWGAPVAQGPGSTTTTAIVLPPTRTRFIRITQTGPAPGNEVWAIQQLRVYARAGD
jgi:glucosylceramidase